jgi:hypothetical protein
MYRVAAVDRLTILAWHHLDPMHDEEFTRMSAMGFTSQLTKLDKRFANG